MSADHPIVIAKAHLVGTGNLFFEAPLKVIPGPAGSYIIAADSGLDAIAIELSAKAVESLIHQLLQIKPTLNTEDLT